MVQIGLIKSQFPIKSDVENIWGVFFIGNPPKTQLYICFKQIAISAITHLSDMIQTSPESENAVEE